MKNLLYLFAFLFTMLLCSCDKEDDALGGKVRINIQASVYDIFKNLTDVSGKPCFIGLMPDNYRLRVAVFLYRYKNSPECTMDTYKVVYLDDAKKEANFQLDVDPGEFQVIATVDVVRMKDDKISYNYNEIVVYEDFMRVNINFKNQGGYNNATGYVVSEGLDLRKSNKQIGVRLNLKPIGALITTCFYNIDSEISKNIVYSMPYSYTYIIRYRLGTGGEYNEAEIYDQTDDFLSALENKSVWVQRYIMKQYTIDENSFFDINWGEKGSLKHTGRCYFSLGTNKFVKIDMSTNEMRVYDEILE